MNIHNVIDEATVLNEALHNVVVAFELSEQDIEAIVGTQASRFSNDIRPESDSRIKVLNLMRIYKCLYSHFSGNLDHMRLWLSGFNKVLKVFKQIKLKTKMD